MDKYSFDILSLLKKQFEKEVGKRQFQLEESGTSVSPRQFYLENLSDNLFDTMSEKTRSCYEKGSGNELKDKMLAIRSSSAMTYNLLGNDNVNLLGDCHIGTGEYNITYEEKFTTLNEASKGTPANLDAFLYCDETKEAIACEMKMGEWIFNAPSKLKEAYLHSNKYIDSKNAQVFVQIAKSLIKSSNKYGYNSCFNTYDVFQMLKHSIALYNACYKKERDIKKLTLVNCVWEPDFIDSLSDSSQKKYSGALKNEHDEFHVFYKSMQPAKALFNAIGVKFDICYYSLSDFAKIMELSEERKVYLRRYNK
ncbi:hypothetical protein SDC9_70839 [bioreactor metagenome]|uniref:Uncharacterized protein n=1 Tax=bioreactor metagenome TaxID=1076179 RepID=A0A644Y859_9ZZZZ